MAGGFVRHRGLIAFSAGGAMAEATLLSFLALSDADLPDPLLRLQQGKPTYSGRLTAAHIQGSWKLDAELVTLSACESGLG